MANDCFELYGVKIVPDAINLEKFKNNLIMYSGYTLDELNAMSFRDLCITGEVFNVHVIDYRKSFITLK